MHSLISYKNDTHNSYLAIIITDYPLWQFIVLIKSSDHIFDGTDKINIIATYYSYLIINIMLIFSMVTVIKIHRIS